MTEEAASEEVATEEVASEEITTEETPTEASPEAPAALEPQEAMLNIIIREEEGTCYLSTNGSDEMAMPCNMLPEGLQPSANE